MKNARTNRSALSVGLLALLARVAAAQMPIQITEFPVGGNPIAITVGSDGNFWMWFSGTTSVARMTPGGVPTYFETGIPFPGATPGHCVDGRDGGVWFSTGGPIGRVSVATGAATLFTLPPESGGAGDLTLGPDGALWFPDFSTNQIGRITVQGAVTEFPLPVLVYPHSITVGPDGALWFTGNGKVGRLDTTGGGFRSYDLPDPSVGAIAAGPDGNLWLCVVDNFGLLPPRVVRVTLDGQIFEFPLPNPLSTGALDIVAGPDGAMWFTDEQANEIGRITTSGVLSEYPLQPNSGPVGITVGRDRAIWFTELAGRVGRISGGPLAPVTVPMLTFEVFLLLAVAIAACGYWVLRLR